MNFFSFLLCLKDPNIKKLREILSSLQEPQVEQVTARSASVRWSSPEIYQGDEDLCDDLGLDPAAIAYELKVVDKTRNNSLGPIQR